MTTRNKKDVESAFERKGFVRLPKGDHRFFSFYIDGKRIALTKTSHGKKSNDLGDALILKMSKQCHLTKSQFLEFVDCMMSQEDYEAILRANDLVD